MYIYHRTSVFVEEDECSDDKSGSLTGKTTLLAGIEDMYLLIMLLFICVL